MAKKTAPVLTAREKLLAEMAANGITLDKLVDATGKPDAAKFAAAMAKLPVGTQTKVAKLLAESAALPTDQGPAPEKKTRDKKTTVVSPPAPTVADATTTGTKTFLPQAGPGSTPVGEGWTDLVSINGSFKASGNAASAKSLFASIADNPSKLAALSRDERDLLAAYAYHLHADPSVGGGGADKAYIPLLSKTDIKGVVDNIHNFQGDKVVRVESTGMGSRKGGNTATEDAADDLSQRSTADHVTQGTVGQTDPDVMTSTATGEAIDLLASQKEIDALANEMEVFNKTVGKKANIGEVWRKNIHGWTGLGKPDGITKIDLAEAQRLLAEEKAKFPKLFGNSDTGSGSGTPGKGRQPAPLTTKNAPVPLPIREELKVATIDELLAKYPSKFMEPTFRSAVQELATGNPKPYEAFLREYATKAEAGGSIPFGLTKEGIAHATGAKPAAVARLNNMRTSLAQDATLKLDELQQKITSLQEKMSPASAAGRPAALLEKLQASLQDIKTGGEVNPAKVGFLSQKLDQLAPQISGNQAVSKKNLDLIEKTVEEITKFGPNVESATTGQLGARAEDIAGLLKAGKGADAASKMGLAEGATLGSMKNVVGTSFFDFLKNHPEKEVRAWAPKIKQAAAQGLGAGAEAGLLESLGTKVAAKGGVVGALGGKLNVAMMVAPLLFTLYSKMKESTEHNRQGEMMQLQQQAAPSARDLLERYRAQRFAEQGVNNMPPSPDFIRRLQSMGPQLTKSEVYIGPDKTEDNLRAMIAQSGEY